MGCAISGCQKSPQTADINITISKDHQVVIGLKAPNKKQIISLQLPVIKITDEKDIETVVYDPKRFFIEYCSSLKKNEQCTSAVQLDTKFKANNLKNEDITHDDNEFLYETLNKQFENKIKNRNSVAEDIKLRHEFELREIPPSL